MKFKILILGLIMAVFSIFVSASTREVCSSGCDYSTIQEAINAALSGDVVYIHNGTYSENLEIAKPLTLQGESTGYVLIECGVSDCLYIHDTQNVTITSLTLYGSGVDGIYLVNTNFSTISNNHIYFNTLAGIELKNSFNNEISYNTIENNDDCAIMLFDSESNEIKFNDISNKDEFYISCGLYLDSSSHNQISNNNISNNDENGVELWSSLNNTLSNNIIKFNQENGLYSDINSLNSVITGNTICYNNQADGGWYDLVIEEINTTADFTGNWCDTASGNYLCQYVCEEAEFLGDVNGDFKVDLIDLATIGQAWGSSEGDANWNGGADLNNDGVVNLFDLAILGQNWGNVY